MNKFSDKLKYYRTQKRLSQEELAKLTGTSQPTINTYESGAADRETLTLRNAVKLAEVLDVQLADLFNIDNKILNLSSDKKSNEYIEKEINKLKLLAFTALEDYESTQIFLKSGVLDENVPEDNKKFAEYREYLREFKNGIYSTLVSKGFCTIDNIKSFKNSINPNKK